MSISAKLKYLHIAPRKVRLVADLIRGKKIDEAQAILNFTTKKSAKPLLKLLKSALANAKHNFQETESNFYISKILVDEGPKFKRFMPRARGSASSIQKKTSHITILLDKIEKKSKEIKELKKAEIVKKEQEKLKTDKDLKEKKSFIDKMKSRRDIKTIKPKTEKKFKRIFRRKAF